MTEFELLAQRVETLLATNQLYKAEADIESLMSDLEAAIGSSPEARKTLGRPLSILKGVRAAVAENPINWVNALEGRVAIGPRPREKQINKMPWYGVTHILTLQAETEKAETIGKLAQARGIEWLWFPMASAALPDENREDELRRVFRAMRDALQHDAGIYIHCAAGIHRTGMITYAFLRYIGLPETTALARLASCRRETSEGAGVDRLAWGNRFANHISN